MKRPLAVAGGGAVVGGHFGTVAALASLPVLTVALTTVVGVCLGSAVGARALTPKRLAALVRPKKRVLLTALPLLGLLGWAAWAGFGTSAGTQFWLAMGLFYLALIGWVTVVQLGQNAESAEANRRGETLVTLPKTDTVGILGLERYRKPVTHLGRLTVILMLGWFLWLAVTESDPLFLLFTVPGVLMVLPGMNYSVHVTEEGLVSENYLGSSIPIGTKLTAWEEIAGYEVADGALEIETGLGMNFSYDCTDIDDVDRLVEILEQYVGEQSNVETR